MRQFLASEKGVLCIWILSAIVFALVKYLIGYYNNYKIFEYSFHHMLNGLDLYVEYPCEHKDSFHYGILFSAVIAPFALLPEWLGIILWVMANTVLLFYALRLLPISNANKLFLMWYALYELMEAQSMQQFNISVAAFIVLAFVFIEQRREFWAAAVIIFGTFIKLYPIVGLAFFFFSKRKHVFVLSLIFWTTVWFAVPFLFTANPEYAWSQYLSWYNSLTTKDSLNMFAQRQNISLLGIFRKISMNEHYSDLLIIVPGLLLFVAPYFRVSQYKHLRFRLMLLASVLFFTILFSTGSEASGYVLCMIGVALWYICSPSPYRVYKKWLLISTLVIVGLANTELVPRFIYYDYILKYVVKAWPCTLVWLTVCYEMLFLDFSQTITDNEIVARFKDKETVCCQ